MQKIIGEQYMSDKDIQEHREQYKKGCDSELEECYTSNFLWNLPILKNFPGILKFKGIFKNYPVVIVGAGPSLKKNMHLLKKHRDKMIIISLDAALPVLVKKLGIYPDLVVMGDPTEKQKLNFEGIDTTKFYTITASVCSPAIFRVIDPKHLAVYNIKSDARITQIVPYHTGSRGALPAGVLSSGSAFGMAGAMHCDPITFIGHDLSWPTPDKVYADGVTKMKHNFQKGAKFKSNCLLFPDINGNLVLTHSTFFNFYIWLRDSVHAVKTRVHNSSEAGILKMKHIKHIPFKKWISIYCKKELIDVEEKIKKAMHDWWVDENGDIETIMLAPLKKRRR